jgi:hypothetical protein
MAPGFRADTFDPLPKEASIASFSVVTFESFFQSKENNKGSHNGHGSNDQIRWSIRIWFEGPATCFVAEETSNKRAQASRSARVRYLKFLRAHCITVLWIYIFSGLSSSTTHLTMATLLLMAPPKTC